MRQRSALHRGSVVRKGPGARSRDQHAKQGRHRVRARTRGWVGVRGHGRSNFDPRSLPMDAAAEEPAYSLNVGAEIFEIGAVSIGNPHAVLCVSNVKTAPVGQLGATIEHHGRFPQRTNVGFMQILDRGHIHLRVFERGAGETLACGTGACAAAAIGRRQGLLDADVRVDLPGGTAYVSWPGHGQHLWLTGPASVVFTGMIDI